MCDASDYAVEAVLAQRKGKVLYPIYYASMTLIEAQINNTTTEKKLLVVMFTFEKFIAYFVGTKVVVYTDHAPLKYLFTKKDVKPQFLCWIFLLQ